jgi:hypothetical protein
LNVDQSAVVAASRAVSEVTPSEYYSRLQATCSAMLFNAQKALRIAHAPSTSLDQAWETMLTQTVTYASDCITLARSHAQSDLTTWNNSLVAMNQASRAWNTQVNATRYGANPSEG